MNIITLTKNFIKCVYKCLHPTYKTTIISVVAADIKWKYHDLSYKLDDSLPLDTKSRNIIKSIQSLPKNDMVICKYRYKRNNFNTGIYDTVVNSLETIYHWEISSIGKIIVCPKNKRHMLLSLYNIVKKNSFY